MVVGEGLSLLIQVFAKMLLGGGEMSLPMPHCLFYKFFFCLVKLVFSINCLLVPKFFAVTHLR
jgi:hypothetical protein